MKKPKLNRCPFCHHKGVFTTCGDEGNYKLRQVHCPECHAQGPLKITDDDAIEAWNDCMLHKNRGRNIPIDEKIVNRTIKFLEDVIPETSRESEEADKLAKYLQQELDEANGKTRTQKTHLRK